MNHLSPSRRPAIVTQGILLAVLISRAISADLYWDINGTTANSGTAASGNWNGTTANWNSDATGGAGGAATALTAAGDTLFFSSGTGHTGASSVTVSGTQNAGALFFEEGTVTLTAATASQTLAFGSGGEINAAAGVTGIIGNNANLLLTGTNGLTKTGAGNIILGNAANAGLTGTISIRAGALAVGSNGTNATNGQPISLGDTTGSASAVLSVNRNQNYNSTVVVNAGSSGTKRISGGPGLGANQAPSITGAVTLNDNVTLGNGATDIYTGNNYGSVRLSGVITGSKTITVDGRNMFTTPQDFTTNYGSTTLAVTKAQISGNNLNTFTGNVAVERGSLEIQNAGALGNGTAVVTTAPGGVLNLNNQSISIAGLGNGSATGGSVANLGNAIAAATGTSTLTLKGSGPYSYGGVIQDGTYTGSSVWRTALTVNLGAGGEQVLTGASTYTGATLITTGTLTVDGSLGATSVTVGADGALGGSGTIAGSVSFNAGAALDVTGATLGPVSTSILTLDSAVTLTLDSFSFADITGWDASLAADGTYTLINGAGTVNLTGTTPTVSTPFAFSATKFGYFQQGSLQAVIFSVPEPGVAALAALSLAMFRRRRRAVA